MCLKLPFPACGLEGLGAMSGPKMGLVLSGNPESGSRSRKYCEESLWPWEADSVSFMWAAGLPSGNPGSWRKRENVENRPCRQQARESSLSLSKLRAARGGLSRVAVEGCKAEMLCSPSPPGATSSPCLVVLLLWSPLLWAPALSLSPELLCLPAVFLSSLCPSAHPLRAAVTVRCPDHLGSYRAETDECSPAPCLCLHLHNGLVLS